jgi:hypothetical protein
MKDQLKRILNLVQKTGDTMIVTDPNGEDVYVVMGLDQYENLRNTEFFDPETELSDLESHLPPTSSFPNDVSWVEEGEVAVSVKEDIPHGEKSSDIWASMKPAGEDGETWDLTKMSEDEVIDLEEQYKKYTQEPELPHLSEISSEAVNKEISPKLEENEDEFGEEQFYLEPIE